ncbi:MAG: hypothetical protein AAB365_00970 [Patescibacteria group bacterium]
MKRINRNNKGLVRTVVIIVIALLVLSYFGFSIRDIVNSPAGRDNFSYAQEVMINVWDNYLKKPVLYLWNDIFLELIWEPAIENLKKIKDGEPDSLRSSAPKISQPQRIPD